MKTAKEVFEKGGVGEELPTFSLTANDVGDGVSIVQLLVKSGLASSGKEAKRLIADNGARLNDELISNAAMLLTVDQLRSPIKLSAGKKRHAVVFLAD